MLCSKAAVGYYNYRHFVQFFLAPSCRNLAVTIGISALISIIVMIVGIGFNSRPKEKITEIHQSKLCWFNRSVIHEFLTLLTIMFLVINIILFILVGKETIAQARLRYI